MRGNLLSMASARRKRALGVSRSNEGVPESGERARAPGLGRTARRAVRIPLPPDRELDPGPLSNEPQMETHAHMMEVLLLLTSLGWWWRDRRDYFASGNLSIFYPVVSRRTGQKVRKKLAFRGPDFFLVLGAKPKPIRNSWVVENEDGKYPDVIVEVLSQKTRATDRGKKKEIYEKIFRTPEYFLFDPAKGTLEGYRLVRGRYVRIAPDAHGRLPSERLGLSFGLHEHPELGRQMARLFTPDGGLVPIPHEAALEATVNEARQAARAEQEAARAEQEAARATRVEQERARLAAKLRELGVDPDITG
jgi:Uma2 family endonuclease